MIGNQLGIMKAKKWSRRGEDGDLVTQQDVYITPCPLEDKTRQEAEEVEDGESKMHLSVSISHHSIRCDMHRRGRGGTLLPFKRH